MPNKKPKVSVCIPNYNCGHFIDKAIQSVLDQTFVDFELIIVDNCSTDDSEAIIKSFSDERIRFYKNERNIGMTKNWNKCLSLAKGEYICFLCADDVYLPHFLEKASPILDLNPNVGFVHSACKMVDEDGKTMSVSRCWKKDFLWKKDDFENLHKIFKRIILSNSILFSTAMIRHNCFEFLGGFDENLAYAPDWELLARIAFHYDVAYIAEPLTCYRKHSANLTAEFAKTGQILIEEYKALEKIISNIPSSISKSILKRETNKIKAFLALNLAFDLSRTCLITGNTKITRQIIALVILLDCSKFLDVRVLLLFLATFLPGKIYRCIVPLIRILKLPKAKK